MNKAVLISLSPYWYYLIMEGIKKLEIRKTRPKDPNWNKEIECYMTKNKKSFARIPKELQNKYHAHMGKVGMQFTCCGIMHPNDSLKLMAKQSCLSEKEIDKYAQGKTPYGLRVSALKIYDKPKDLSEFKKEGFMTEEQWLYALYPNTHCHYTEWAKRFEITRPPQSWCYVINEKETH